MYDYIKGILTEIDVNNVSIESNGIGYRVFVGNPYEFKIDKEYKVYLYSHIREDEYTLYGFSSKEVRDMFLRLISVKGLGPKVALPMLATSTIEGLEDAIEKENILYLKKFPKVGEKLARQLILDLKGKLAKKANSVVVNEELESVLLSLGYKSGDIKKVIKDVDSSKSIEEQIKEALKLLIK